MTAANGDHVEVLDAIGDRPGNPFCPWHRGTTVTGVCPWCPPKNTASKEAHDA